MLTEAQKLDAYREAQQLLRLDEKWQHLMPGERKPNFRRAAREIVRRALGHKVQRNQTPLQLHDGLMHEHDPREAALLERTLKNGHHDPRILHSFHTGVTKRPQPKRPIVEPDMDVEVYLHNNGDMIDYPSHFEPGTGVFHSSVHVPETHVLVNDAQRKVRLPTDYEVVH